VGRFSSLKEASEFTGLRSSTISEHIKALEAKLETQLFTRTQRGLVLTQRGAALFEHAKVVFEEGYKLLEKFSGGNEVGGYPVSVGIDSAIPDEMSSDIISHYWDQYAKYGVVNAVRQADHEVLFYNLLQENMEWGLSLTPSKRKSLISQPIGNYTFSFCCLKEIYERFKRKDDLIRYIPYADCSFHHPFRKKINTFVRSLGLESFETCHTDNFHLLLSLLNKGRVFAFLPDIVIKKHPELKAFHFRDKFSCQIFAIWRLSQRELIPISVLKSLLSTRLSRSKSQPFLQIEASGVPHEKLKPLKEPKT